MMTTSQVALALDVLAHMPIFPPRPVHMSGSLPPLEVEDPREALVRKAAAVIELAFTPGWTGKMEGQCNEYGKAPVSEDPEAQSAVMKLTAIRARLAAECSRLTTEQFAEQPLLHDLELILDK